MNDSFGLPTLYYVIQESHCHIKCNSRGLFIYNLPIFLCQDIYTIEGYSTTYNMHALRQLKLVAKHIAKK